MYHILSIHPLMDFCVASTSWLIVNSTAINMHVQISFLDSAFNSFGFIPRSGIAGSCNSSIFNYLWNFHTVFCSDCTILQSHQEITRVPISPHLCQCLFSVIFIVAIQMSMKCYFIAILMCILSSHSFFLLAMPLGMLGLSFPTRD